MSSRKMLVVHLTKTNAVLAAATRRASGAPPVAELVGTELFVRRADQDAAVPVPADQLVAEEVDYNDDVLRQPLEYVVDASGSVVAAASNVTLSSTSSISVGLTVPSGTPADKAVLLVIDAGSNQPPLTFAAKTVNATTVTVPISGVPPGEHMVLASVDGLGSAIDSRTF